MWLPNLGFKSWYPQVWDEQFNQCFLKIHIRITIIIIIAIVVCCDYWSWDIIISYYYYHSYHHHHTRVFSRGLDHHILSQQNNGPGLSIVGLTSFALEFCCWWFVLFFFFHFSVMYNAVIYWTCITFLLPHLLVLHDLPCKTWEHVCLISLGSSGIVDMMFVNSESVGFIIIGIIILIIIVYLYYADLKLHSHVN